MRNENEGITMKYAIWQIPVTDEILEDPISNELRRDVIWGERIEEAVKANLYRLVGKIEADNLEDVFEIGNIGPEKRIKRFGPMSSVSVGNLIEDEDGKFFVVKNIGFEELSKTESVFRKI